MLTTNEQGELVKTGLSFSTRLKRLFLGEVNSLSFGLGFVAFLLSAGFFFANSQTENYELINNHGSQFMWAVIYLAYSLARMGSGLYRYSNGVKIVVVFAGLTLWSLLFLSFVLFDVTPMRPTELMLALPILLEFWLAIHAIDCIKRNMIRRLTDGG